MREMENEDNRSIFEIFDDMKKAYERYMEKAEADMARMRDELENLPELMSKTR